MTVRNESSDDEIEAALDWAEGKIGHRAASDRLHRNPHNGAVYPRLAILLREAYRWGYLRRSHD